MFCLKAHICPSQHPSLEGDSVGPLQSVPRSLGTNCSPTFHDSPTLILPLIPA